MPKSKISIIGGSASTHLAEKIAKHLKTDLTPIEAKRFSDGETYARILKSVRGSDVFVVQSTNCPANDNLMELLILLDALKRASPCSITAVIPYYGYSRQDKKIKAREPITAKLVANMIQTAGAQRVITLELHVPQVQGFFDVPSDNLDILPFFAEYLSKKEIDDFIVVSPDAGGTTRSRIFAKIFNVPIAIIDKRRRHHNQAEVHNVIGDVKDKNCVIIDDMIDTAGTLSKGAEILKKHGAKEIFAIATHPIFSDPAIERLEKAPITEVLVSDTIYMPDEMLTKKIKIISCAEIIAEAIKRSSEGISMGRHYEDLYKKLNKQIAGHNV